MNLWIVFVLMSVGVSPIVTRTTPPPVLGNFPFELDWGPCIDPRTVENFNPRKFAGTWYEIKRYKSTITTGKCGTARFEWDSSNEMLNFTYTNLDNTEYLSLVPTDLDNGRFRLHIRGREMPVDYLLLDTDYVNYAVSWTCFEVLYGSANTQTLHIFGRTPTLSPAILATAENVISSRKLSLEKLENVMQRERTCRRDDD